MTMAVKEQGVAGCMADKYRAVTSQGMLDREDKIMMENKSLSFMIGRQLDQDRALKERDALLSVLKDKAVTVLFQPVVNLAKPDIIGYEIFIRGPGQSPLYLPEQLFAAAHKFNLANQLEELCREVVLLAAAANNITGKLFVNIDPCADVSRHVPGYIHRILLPELGQTLQNVVVEINQQHLSDPSCSILECASDFFKQGFPIAIDGVGTGFSSLQSISSLRPSYLKIDRSLVHNANANQYHAKLISVMADYGRSIGAKVIAQGVETEQELSAVMKLGLNYAQGYLFAKPAPAPGQLSPAVCELIQECKKKIRRKPDLDIALGMSVGEIVEYGPVVESGTLVNQAEALLLTEKAGGIVVLSQNKPIGLLMKNRLYFQLGTRYGLSLYHSRPVDLVMDKNPLVVDAGLPLDSVSHLAMSRADDNKYDFIVVTQSDEYAGVVSIPHLLNNMTNLQVRCATNANPLTGLPGNLMIDLKLKALVEKKLLFAVFYVDLDNFKAFNDKYGFERGDQALLLTAEILRSCVDRVCRQESFLGHIGGDDFVIIVHPEEIDSLGQAIIQQFDREISALYDPQDLARGFILVNNRYRQPERFPVMTISIGVVHTLCRGFSNYLEIGGIAAALKKQAKEIEGSTYVVDQRRPEQ